jgi:hypothetical protein
METNNKRQPQPTPDNDDAASKQEREEAKFSVTTPDADDLSVIPIGREPLSDVNFGF